MASMSPSPMVDLGGKPGENLAREEDASTDTYDLGSKAVDSYVVRRKLMGSTLHKYNSDAETSGNPNPIHSKLLIPGVVYSTPTKFTPFKPLDLYPQQQKTSNEDEEASNTNSNGTLQTSSAARCQFPSTPNKPKNRCETPSPSHGSLSPTRASPGSVVKQAVDDVDGDEVITTLVQAIEEVMRKSGTKVDCSELRTQLIQLQAKEIIPEGPASSVETDFPQISMCKVFGHTCKPKAEPLAANKYEAWKVIGKALGGAEMLWRQ